MRQHRKLHISTVYACMHSARLLLWLLVSVQSCTLRTAVKASQGCHSVPAAHAIHEPVEELPVVKKLVAHAQKCQLMQASIRCTSPDSALVHAIKGVLVIPARISWSLNHIELCAVMTLLRIRDRTIQVSIHISTQLRRQESTEINAGSDQGSRAHLCRAFSPVTATPSSDAVSMTSFSNASGPQAASSGCSQSLISTHVKETCIRTDVLKHCRFDRHR